MLSRIIQGLTGIMKYSEMVGEAHSKTYDIELMCSSLKNDAIVLKKEYPNIAIVEGIENIANSARNIRRLFKAHSPMARLKVQYELIPLVQEVIYDAYFFTAVFGNKNAEKQHYEKDYFEMKKNPYPFSYELSIVVLAYDKLEYTKQCVESILDNVPEISYELILLNNGSSDSTEDYFNSLGVAKTIHLKQNSLSNIRLYSRITEGRYILSINNDVIVTPNAIQNLLACIKSDARIGMVVPTTPNISNDQDIPFAYENYKQVQAYGAMHNVADAGMWEDRHRLCNPISIMRASALRKVGEHDSYFVHGEFSDDALSYRLRRAGYRLILARDTFCYHFGSVTLQEAREKQNTLGISRALFMQRYGFDAWGDAAMPPH
jgi:O-antigen biosynthesis protein